MESRAKARRGLALFFVMLIAGSTYFEHKILVLGGAIEHRLGLIYALMWWVAVSSVIARLILRESPRDISFRWGGWAGTRAILAATALPGVAASRTSPARSLPVTFLACTSAARLPRSSSSSCW